MAGIVELIERAARENNEKLYAVSQICKIVDRSEDIVKTWIKKNPELVKDRKKMPLGDEGSSFAWCYTEADKNRIVKHAASKKLGRPTSKEV